MCGILGITHARSDEMVLLDLLQHRGPDAKGVFIDTTSRVFLGHTRLAIVDLTSASGQPMSIEDGTVVIIYNGEIYNFLDLRKELEDKGIVFKSQGDTEVILRGYTLEGVDFFKKLRGMWSFAIYDKRAGVETIVLSRDPFGIKPIYYSLQEGRLFFASELKAIRPLLVKEDTDIEGYAEFFNFGYFIAPSTCFKNVHQLLPGEVLRCKVKADSVYIIDKAVIVSASLPAINAENGALTYTEALENVEKVLKKSIEAHFYADVNVGLLFSGGLDSLLIACLAKELGLQPKMFHVSVPGSIDTKHSIKAAEYLGLPLTIKELNNDFFAEQYTRVLAGLDLPTADLSFVPTALVFSSLGKDIKVALSGEGGDEFFGGYYRHELFHGKDMTRNKASLYEWIDRLGIGPLKTRLNEIVSRFHLSNDLIGAYLASTRIHTYRFKNDIVRQRMMDRWVGKKDDFKLPKGLFFDIEMYLKNNLMQKSDTASMMFSIEARVPMLDRVFYDALSKLPQDYIYPKDTRKKIIKDILRKHVPTQFIERKKSGFSFQPETVGLSMLMEDLDHALNFHRNNQVRFGIVNTPMTRLLTKKPEYIMKKFPRLAFAFITNWKVLCKNQ